MTPGHKSIDSYCHIQTGPSHEKLSTKYFMLKIGRLHMCSIAMFSFDAIDDSEEEGQTINLGEVRDGILGGDHPCQL